MATLLYNLWILFLIGFVRTEDTNENSALPKDFHYHCSATNKVKATNNCDMYVTGTVEKMKLSDLQRDEALQETCASWKETNDCYERLMTSCKDRGEDEMLYYYERAQERMDIYSQTCLSGESLDSSKGTVVNCYIPLLGRPQQCLRNFNNDYFDSVAKGNNTHACRLVGTLLLCYSEVKTNLSATCGLSAGQDFHDNKVESFVFETQDFVRNNCLSQLPNQYSKMYSDGNEHRITTLCILLMTAVPFYFI